METRLMLINTAKITESTDSETCFLAEKHVFLQRPRGSEFSKLAMVVLRRFRSDGCVGILVGYCVYKMDLSNYEVSRVLVTCRSRMSLIKIIRDLSRGTQREELFNNTCFGGETENVPLYYHMHDNFHIQFEREEFCLITGLKFGVEYPADYDAEDQPIPFRRRVFPSCLDERPRREHRPSVYMQSPYTPLPPTTELPKKRVGKTKKKCNNDNLSPLNLGNAFAYDNAGGDDVVITGVHDTGIYFTYENGDPNKRMNAWIEILIRSRPQNVDLTVSKSGTACVHNENNRFMIETDPHIIGTLNGSTRPYPP
nr:phospholipase-like protein [Tanacetum cinerariifolium]